ncbi:TPA: hypothetical protein QCX13_001555 [Bacillus toyonensis]|nr:hypothetical protein [Bacillus toyonensis]
MSNKIENRFYEPFQNMKFDDKHCFLCGVELNDINGTQEHVIPKWLQKKYNLWHQTLTLQNNTKIQYRQLTIPCCKICNNVHLSVIEDKVKNAVNVGYDEFIKLDEKTIFQWIGKIYYGILFKELNIMDFTTKPIENKIMTKKRLEDYKMLHECLQSIHLPINFHGFLPWSIFVVKLHPRVNNEHNFHFIDSIFLSASMQLGDIGIITNLGDNGSIKKRMEEKIKQYHGIPLHEAQFIELVSEMIYHSFLLEKTPARFFISSGEPVEGYDIAGISTGRFSEFQQEVFSYLFKTNLERIIGYSPKNIYIPETNNRVTMLENLDGNIHVLNADGSVNNEYYLDKYGVLPNYMGKSN